MITTLNPYTKEYYDEEIKAFKVKEGTYRDIVITTRNVPSKDCDAFMCKGFGWKEDVKVLRNVPIFTILGNTWMSLTPMEIETHFLPIQLAHGNVGVAGLGMGYYVQRILDKEEVDRVTVYEVNKDVIKFYRKMFGDHEKLDIVCKNAYNIEGETFDFFYNDIYYGQLNRWSIRDMANLTRKNNFKDYHFWTLEGLIFEMLLSGINFNLIPIRSDSPLKIQRYLDLYKLFAEYKTPKAQGIGHEALGEFKEHGII